MSSADLQKWDDKYRGGQRPTLEQAEPVLARHVQYLPASGQVLDLACGKGANALFLAQRGLDVLALDGSAAGLKLLQKAAEEKNLQARIQTRQADLDHYVLPRASFDLIVVIRYLNRPLFASIEAALKPGGVLYYQTFNTEIRHSRPGFNQDFTIEKDELSNGFPGLEIQLSTTESQHYSLLIGRKPFP